MHVHVGLLYMCTAVDAAVWATNQTAYFASTLGRKGQGSPQDFKNVWGIYEQFAQPRRGVRGPPKGPANFGTLDALCCILEHFLGFLSTFSQDN